MFKDQRRQLFVEDRNWKTSGLTSLLFTGPEELGGRVGTKTVAGYAAPGTPLNDPETWEGIYFQRTCLKSRADILILCLTWISDYRSSGAADLAALQQINRLNEESL